MNVNLQVELGALTLDNPIILASGTCGYGLEMASHIDLDIPGAIVLKSITLKPQKGNRPPRTVETSCGLINSIGLENEGVDYLIEHILPRLTDLRCCIIASIAGKTVSEYARVAEKISTSSHPPDALEVNISCPNVKEGGMSFGVSATATREVISAVRRATSLPLIAKLTPNVSDPVSIAQAAEEAEADAISLINTVLALAIDWRSRKSKLGAFTGGLSGPCIKPVALRMVWQVASATHIPVIGIGGISSAEDVLEFIVAGASAVQIGTANLIDPTIAVKIIPELKTLLRKEGITEIQRLVGTLQRENSND
jgi:dihydroorotate dehydrogenase (NAD+) catalytic subunit